jgi:hypothetical protein
MTEVGDWASGGAPAEAYRMGLFPRLTRGG